MYFHGPAYQVLGRAWRYDGGSVGRYSDGLPANHVPADLPTVTGPRLVELCFQTAGLWQAGREGRLGLPQHVDAVRVVGDPAAAHRGLHAIAQPSGDGYDCVVVDEQGDVLIRLNGYRTVELPGVLPNDVRAPLAAAMAD
jgi:hypothetical protein